MDLVVGEEFDIAILVSSFLLMLVRAKFPQQMSKRGDIWID